MFLKINNKHRGLYIVGDINTQYSKLIIKIKLRKLKNSDIIIISNFGIGVVSDKIEKKILSDFNNDLFDNNNHIYINKGYVDNSVKFKYYKEKYSNIHFVENYDILTFNGDGFLFLNESTKINRSYDFNPKRTKPTTFIATNITYSKKIKYIISNESPDFIHPYNLNNLKPFTKLDKWLYNDIKKNRLKLTKIYDELLDRHKKINTWFISKYNIDLTEEKNNTTFIHIKKISFFKLS